MIQITTAFVDQLRAELGADNVRISVSEDATVLTAMRDGETVTRSFSTSERKLATCWDALKNS